VGVQIYSLSLHTVLNTCPVANESVSVLSKSVQQLGPKIILCLELSVFLVTEEYLGDCDLLLRNIRKFTIFHSTSTKV